MFTPRSLKLKVHSRRVRIFKQSLPIGAFLLASLIFVWPVFLAQKEKMKLAQKPSDVLEGASVNMDSVKFISTDSKDQPFNLFSTSIVETDVKNKIITLTQPKGTLSLKSGVVIDFKSNTGLLYQKERLLKFNEKVYGSTNNGWKMTALNAVYDYNAEQLSSSSVVEVKGNEGYIKAEKGFILWDKQNKLSFLGKSKGYVRSTGGIIHLSCEKEIHLDQTKQTMTAEQNVAVKQGEGTIYADKMIMYYKKNGKKSFDQIEKIEAFGHVKGVNSAQTITGEKGIYSPATGKMEVTGNVVLKQGGTHVKGEKMDLNLKTGISTLNAGEKQNNRIKGQLMPADFMTKKGQK